MSGPPFLVIPSMLCAGSSLMGRGPVLVFTEIRKEANDYANRYGQTVVRTADGIAVAEQLELFSEPTESSQQLQQNAQKRIAILPAAPRWGTVFAQCENRNSLLSILLELLRGFRWLGKQLKLFSDGNTVSGSDNSLAVTIGVVVGLLPDFREHQDWATAH